MIDDEDFELISRYKWYTQKGNNGIIYAATYSANNNNRIKMHRLIMGITNPKIEIDHIDHDGLNNQKQNLRLCSHQQNSMNQRKTKGTSKYKGVYWDKERNKRGVRIGYNYKKINLGRFDEQIDAAKAYDKKAIELFGEFAQTNFMKDHACF